MSYRIASKKDIDQLVEIENHSFDTDMLSKRQFLYFIEKAHSYLLVLEKKGVIQGYGLLLFHQGTSLARLYSIAINPSFRGQKLGQKILEKLEEVALEEDCTYIRLEVKVSNKSAINLYEKLGYRKFSHKLDYYEDHQDALCYEKKIKKKIRKPKLKVPYYEQTLEFTCGPSSLMMAMKTFDASIALNQDTEMQLWREATTIFMTSGHGGCGPHGLALAAYKRGFEVELYLNSKAPLFVEGVRNKKKKEVIEIVQKQFERKLKQSQVKVFYDEYSWETISQILKDGGIPLILISAYRLTETKSPHWICITGIQEDFIFFHDSDIDDDQNKIDNMDIPVRKDEFEKMAKFGSRQLKSIVAIYSKK